MNIATDVGVTFETPQAWGLIPTMISETDPRPIREQIAAHYIGGWRPLAGFQVGIDKDGFPVKLIYKGDPDLKPIGRMWLCRADGSTEKATLFEHDWVAAKGADGTWEVSRVD